MPFDQGVKLVTLVIDAAKVVAWPLLIGWLAWYLRDELKKAASRIVKVGVWGAEVALESTVPQQCPARTHR